MSLPDVCAIFNGWSKEHDRSLIYFFNRREEYSHRCKWAYGAKPVRFSQTQLRQNYGFESDWEKDHKNSIIILKKKL